MLKVVRYNKRSVFISHYFGIKSLKDLPQITEFENLQIEENNFDFSHSDKQKNGGVYVFSYIRI